MKRRVAGLVVALVIAGFWVVVGSDGLASGQSDCVSQGAVSSSETALAADCEVLLEIRDTLAGTATLNWAADTPIEDWEGVSVGGTPLRVVEIRLLARELTGTIPSELGELSGLTRLWLLDNQLVGTIPDDLGNLSNLEEMTLGENQLTGEVPTQLGNLSNLTWLSLRGNQLTGTIPGRLGSLSGLKGLSLGDNQLTGTIPTQLGDLSNLTWLNLWGNQLTGTIPAELGNLPNLTWLDLSNNRLTGQIPPQLGDLSNLTWLDLSNNRLTGSIPPELGSLSSLVHLYLHGNQLTGCIPAELEDVEFNDFDEVGLPFCAPQVPGAPSVGLLATTTPTVRIDSPIPVTATFSEPVNGFVAGDVTVANGDVSNFVGSDGDSVYIFDVTPNVVGVVTVDIAAGVATDFDGEANTAAVQLTLGLPYDDDHDGAISRDEVVAAIGDYLFGGLLSRKEVTAIIALYLFG